MNACQNTIYIIIYICLCSYTKNCYYFMRVNKHFISMSLKNDAHKKEMTRKTSSQDKKILISFQISFLSLKYISL